jgi:hypothetical protein
MFFGAERYSGANDGEAGVLHFLMQFFIAGPVAVNIDGESRALLARQYLLDPMQAPQRKQSDPSSRQGKFDLATTDTKTDYGD